MLSGYTKGTTKMIIHRGTLTIEKLKELCFKHLEIKSDSDKYSPEIHNTVISLIKQEDGNWKGHTQKNGKMIETREQSPEYALQAILTYGN